MTGGGPSIPEVQRLLAVLARGRRCAEAGTAFGDGAAALASTASSVVTVESDLSRARLARARLAPLANVELVVGDWEQELPPRAPFDLLFLDGGSYKREPERIGPVAIDVLAPGGMLVIDDLTPGRPRSDDPARAFLVDHPALVAAEVLTTPDTAAIVVVRR